jgi:hypothetical protein
MSKRGREPFEALFEQARGDAFTPIELERLWRGIAVGGSAVGGPGPESVGTAASGGGWAGTGAALKLAAVLIVAGGVGVAGLAAKRAQAPVADSPASTSALSTTGVEAGRSELASESAGPPTLSWEDLPRSPGAPAGPLRPQRPRVGSAPPPGPEVEATAAIEAIASTPDAPVAPAGPTAGAPDRQPNEGALLLRARQSLTSDPAAALILTDEDARRFPAGPLAPEGEVLAVEALVRLHRLGEAKARLAAFRVRYPQSPHLARLDALVGR